MKAESRESSDRVEEVLEPGSTGGVSPVVSVAGVSEEIPERAEDVLEERGIGVGEIARRKRGRPRGVLKGAKKLIGRRVKRRRIGRPPKSAGAIAVR